MNIRWLVIVLLLMVFPEAAQAARINELTDTDFSSQLVRFLSLRDPSLRYALGGTVLLGLSCGVMGVFLIVRRMALMSDALSHAVLPGIALGFLWNMTRDPFAIFIGATVAALLGAGVAQAITRTTRHHGDAALGFVLASFFGVGICLVTMIQNLPDGNKSGLDKFMFGQAAAMGTSDVALLAGVTSLVIAAIWLWYKEFQLCSFDPGFARSIGLPVDVLHYGLMLLLAFAIVASLQAVGVVLVAAMLVIPAATAFLLTQRLGAMLFISAGLGVLSGCIGAFVSFVGPNLPTGPLMVVSAAALFLLTFTLTRRPA